MPTSFGRSLAGGVAGLCFFRPDGGRLLLLGGVLVSDTRDNTMNARRGEPAARPLRRALPRPRARGRPG